MFDDLAKTVKAQLYERASSPLLGSFTIAWIAWNYRFILVLISSMPVAEKFTYIDSNIFNSPENIFLRGSLYPLLTSLLLIFAYPIPAKFVYGYSRKRQRELKEVRQRIDDETPLTREEARELRQETLQATLKLEQELDRKILEVSKLKEVIKASQPDQIIFDGKMEPENPSSQEADNAINQLTELQTTMLKLIAESSYGVYAKNLIASSGPDKVLAEYNLDELETREFVTKSYDNEYEDFLFKPTRLGRSYLINQTKKQ